MLRWTLRCVRALPSLGLVGAIQLFFAYRSRRVFHIRPRGYARPLEVRGNTSDPVLIYLIFCVHEYPLIRLPEMRWIIDAGANVGYFAVFAAHHYPEAKIVAIEPEASNYEVMLRNIAGYPQIIPLKAGLWSETGRLTIANPQAEKWCFQCAAAAPEGTAATAPIDGKDEGVTMEAVTVRSLQAQFGIDVIDVLKIDIEGGEREVFSAVDTSWLGAVRVLIAELHRGCWKSCFEAMQPYTYDCCQLGENTIFLMGDLATQQEQVVRRVGS